MSYLIRALVALLLPLHPAAAERASRSTTRPPLVGGPVVATPRHEGRNIIRPKIRPYDTFTDAPHTHAGLAAWSRTLPWPWPGIISCESLSDDTWSATSTSWARGPFQILRSTWASLGMTGDPATYPWRVQYREAVHLAHRDGLRHSWVCARQLGY